MPYLSQKILGDLLYDQVVRKPYLRGSIVPASNRPRMTYGRTRYSRFRGANVGSKNSKQLATKGYVKKALEREDVGIEVTAVSGSYSLGNLVDYRLGKNIDKGTDSGDRKGKDIYLKALRMFGTFRYVNAATGTPTGCYARLVVVVDKQPLRLPEEAMFATISDSNQPVDYVNLPTTPATLEPINIVRPLNPSRYTVLHEVIYKMGDPAVNGMGTSNLKVFDETFKINRKLTYTPEYNTSGTGITPCLKFLLFFCRESGSGATNGIQFNYQIEEHFTG